MRNRFLCRQTWQNPDGTEGWYQISYLANKLDDGVPRTRESVFEMFKSHMQANPPAREDGATILEHTITEIETRR